MKTLFICAALCTLFISCNQIGNSQNTANNYESDDDGEKSELEKKVSKRDYSITRQNAYNDLFLDSMAMENFFTQKKTPDAIIRRMRSFYNARNYQYAWFTSNGLTEQALGFWNLHNFYTTYSGDTSLTDKALKKKMDNLLTDSFSVSTADKGLLSTEFTLTHHFIDYSLKKYEKGYIKRKEMERFIPRKKDDALYLADSLLSKKHKDNKYFEDVNQSYKLLKEQLIKYHQLAKSGGWQPISLPKKATHKKGASSPTIASIKKFCRHWGICLAQILLRYSMTLWS
jgi:hypothetical protein